MQADELLFYKIEDYLRNRLSPEERAALESEMANDAALAAQVRRQQQEKAALEVLAERDLRAQMRTWERQETPPQQLRPLRGGRLLWLRWAAAAMVVFAAGWWLFRQFSPVEAPGTAHIETPVQKPPMANKPQVKPRPKPGTPTRPEQRRPTTNAPKDVIAEAPKTSPAPAKKTIDYAAVADEYYRENDFFSGPGTAGKGNTRYDRALNDFRNGRYGDLVPQLKPGGKADPNDLKTRELLAHSLLKNRQYDAAVTAFREIVNRGQQPYADRADWALALTYLRQMPRRSGELEQVLQKMISRPGHLFNGKARMLRARLGN